MHHRQRLTEDRQPARQAARLGASVISNSYGTTEDGFALANAGSYNHPGHTIVVSSGDAGFGAANFPPTTRR